ncbi:UvrD/REP type DNA helicase [Hesseltinella vesiculosa]|uniref:DNA 3'-5' helicase n=1 Tax=Hesseltinella vesiculosa TaxID=101127 RepID=A0A1X2G4V4_9FUNG|nr:UvrD/REP type DNA helicase [Hesseltinella vesiculosa]
MIDSYLDKLDPYQVRAVTHPSNVLQICAGPGSGKTRALTTRVAHLIHEHNIKPTELLVVTFTNKAANEMKERLLKPTLLGRQAVYIRMGTFHSVCSRLIRANAEAAGVNRNFGIADGNTMQRLGTLVFKELCAVHPDMLRTKPGFLLGSISKMKNDGYNLIEYLDKFGQDRENLYLTMLYQAYTDRLKSENLLDFDDLILVGRDLLKNEPSLTDNIKHVLVDEFQDTSTSQYQLIQYLTKNGEKGLTVVGDPDQSIYGWRSARVENFEIMFQDYPGTQVTYLSKNYRSTKNILASANHVVKQDSNRPDRELFTDNDNGALISLMQTNSDVLEAETVATEIERIIKYTKGLVNYKGIAVLFRMNYLTFNFEQAFTRAKIPFVVVSGLRFLDRMEIKDLVAYMQLFFNPKDSTAFERIINVPRRGLGQVSVSTIQKLARDNSFDHFEIIHKILTDPSFSSQARLATRAQVSLRKLVDMRNEFMEMVQQELPIHKILDHIIRKIDYEGYIRTFYQKDAEVKMANVGELISYAKRTDEENVLDK